MKKFTMILMAAVLILSVSGFVSAQEEDDKYVFAYGSLVSKSNDAISVSEFNYETDTEQTETYAVNEDTSFEGIGGLSELDIGDDIELLYEMLGGQKIASMISKSTLGVDDLEMIDGAGEENQPDLDEVSEEEFRG